MAELYLQSFIHLHGAILNQLRIRTNLSVTFTRSKISYWSLRRSACWNCSPIFPNMWNISRTDKLGLIKAGTPQRHESLSDSLYLVLLLNNFGIITPSNRLHGVTWHDITWQKTILFITAGVRTSHPACFGRRCRTNGLRRTDPQVSVW